MNQLRRFMYGRYGFDHLTQFLLWVAIILTLASSLSHIKLLVYLSYIIIAYALFRVLSKNTNRRTKENFKFLEKTKSIRNIFSKMKMTINGTKTHRYYSCPKCRQTIRVPKGKGKIRIICPKCKTEFIKRT